MDTPATTLKTPIYIRRASNNYYHKIKNDPERYEAYKKTKREYQREYYHRKKKEKENQSINSSESTETIG